jgi:toxin YoeB
VEQLRGDRKGQWSRHIDKKNRLIYTIADEIVTVEVISARGHYDDK